MSKNKKKTALPQTVTKGQVEKLSGNEAKKALSEVTRDANNARLERVRKRFKETAPAPQYSAEPFEDGKIRLKLDGDASALLDACGTANISFADNLTSQLSGAICHNSKPEQLNVANAGLAALAGIAPKDETEAMLAAQMVATHQAAMKMLGGAVRAEYLDQAEWKSGFAIKLLRTYTAQMEALARYRGHGQQTVRVEHVTVNAGGQAIVGNVNPAGGGGAKGKTEEQPHESAIEYQPVSTLPPLRCADTAREALPIPRDAQR